MRSGRRGLAYSLNDRRLLECRSPRRRIDDFLEVDVLIGEASGCEQPAPVVVDPIPMRRKGELMRWIHEELYRVQIRLLAWERHIARIVEVVNQVNVRNESHILELPGTISQWTFMYATKPSGGAPSGILLSSASQFALAST